MQEHDLTVLISKVSVLFEQYERRCHAVEQQLHAQVQELRTVAQQLPAVLRQAADGSLQTMPAQVVGKVKEGLERTVNEYEQRFHAAGKQMGDSTHSLDQQVQRSERVHRLLIWKILGVTMGCLFLLLAGGLWLSMHYAGVIRDNQLSAEALTLYSAADLVNCDGRLYARVDFKGKHYGEKGEYLPVKQR